MDAVSYQMCIHVLFEHFKPGPGVISIVKTRSFDTPLAHAGPQSPPHLTYLLREPLYPRALLPIETSKEWLALTVCGMEVLCVGQGLYDWPHMLCQVSSARTHSGIS